MAFLSEDPTVRLRCYRNALRNWSVEGYIVLKERAQLWLRSELSHYSWREIRRKLYQYVESGGEIDEQRETRPEYAHYEFHFDLRPTIDGRRVYFETVLLCEDSDDPDDPIITVVNVHDV